jgi:hypothetical protein
MSPSETEAAVNKAHKRITNHVKGDARRWTMLTWVVIAEFVLIAVLSVAFLVLLDKANTNQQKIAHNHDAITLSLEHTSFRQCARINNDRAVAHFYIARGQAKIEHRLQMQLPILDCDPNVVGRPAHPLSAAKQSDFVKRWAANTLTAAERGICPEPPDESIC